MSFYGIAVFRLQTNAKYPARYGIFCWSRAGEKADAKNGFDGDLSEATDEPTTSQTQGVSISASESADYKIEPSLVHGYYVYSHETRVSVPRGGHGLAQSRSVILAIVEHDGYGFLRGSIGRGYKSLWSSRNIQY